MYKILKEKEFLKTSDLLTCNILSYFNHTLEAVDHSNVSRCIFIIKREHNTDEILRQFYEGLLLVEPKRFQSIQKEIKSRIYNK